MRVTKVTYQKAFIVGPYLQEKVGFEAEINEFSETPQEALWSLKSMAEDWHKDANPKLDGSDLPPHLKTEVTFGNGQPLPTISKEKERLEIAIDNAQTLDQMRDIKEQCWLAGLPSEWIEKFNALNNKTHYPIMEQINGDFHLISEDFLKEVLRRPPLDPDYWWKQKKSTSLKGTIIVTIEELREVWMGGANRMEFLYGKNRGGAEENIPDFETYLQSKGITLMTNG